MYKASFEHDRATNRILVTRRFDATRSRVWKAWTDPELLDKWWGPSPWRAVTRSFDFRVGGHWHYCMTGPDGHGQWCLVAYQAIDPENSFSARDCFCDEQGQQDPSLPANNWSTRFIDHQSHTEVVVTIEFDCAEDMDRIIQMGFEQGFAMGLDQLQQWLARPPANSRKFHWSVMIDAQPETVWQRTFAQDTYREWTAEFSAGSYYEGQWAEGEILRFLGPGKDGAEPSGMLSVVRELRPQEFSSVEHLGMIVNGKIDTSSDEALSMASCFENYTLTAQDGGTLFSVEMDLNEEYQAMFDKVWPAALARLKAICER